jgi:hypothetical protein
MKDYRIGRWIISVTTLLLMCVLLGGASLTEAKDRKKTITFSEDVMLNETVIKKGTYELKFDSANSKVLILKDDKEVASAKVHVETGTRKALHNSASFKTTDKGQAITGITFAGDKRTLVIDS